MSQQPDTTLIADFERDGYLILKDAITPQLRAELAAASSTLLASRQTHGRDQGADGKDGFRGIVGLDSTFLPLVANPAILPLIVALLSPNVHLLTSHLIALPSIPAGGPRTIRVPERTGWHTDMFGVARDLGLGHVPRMAVKCAYYLSNPGPSSGTTVFLPRSHLSTVAPTFPNGGIDPLGAVVPDIGPNDAVLFENRTWHAGGINTSGHPRLAVMMQYGYRWLAPVDDRFDQLLQATTLTDVERQLLGAPDRNADGSMAKGTGAAPLRQLVGEDPPTN